MFVLHDTSMTDDALPTQAELVSTACGVCETLFNLQLHHDRSRASLPDATWRAKSLVLTGACSLKVVIASDDAVLARMVESLGADGADPDSLVDSALGEMVNLIAGQLKAVLARDYSMGLPQAESQALSPGHAVSAWLSSSDGRGMLWAAVSMLP